MKLAGGANTSGTGGTPRWKELVVMLTPLVFFTGLLLAVACLVDGLLHLIQKTDMPAAYFSALGPYGDIFILGLVLLTILCVLLSHFDINELSMNQFYRNRLMRCYLGASRPQNVRKPQAFTGFDFADDAPLSHFGTAVAGTFSGPFWIVNTALNTAKNPDLDVAERRAESFILTPLYCGFERKGYGAGGGDLTINQGYRPTAEYLGGSMNAGQAVSISGAAASPNSGYHTSPLVAFMLTVFNARLGWWAANPVSAQDWKLASAPWRRSIAWYVLKELFGSASAADPYIYLSDGGHFENLGLYELVRRRTGLIIVSDAEEDGNYTFHALGTAIRRCWIDFQVKIEISASTIMPKEPGGMSSAHCEIGKIYYPDQTVGTLIYMKSSWSGDEPTDLQQYRSANSAFPHESTGDQFFSESQFESYRKLGRHVAREGLSSTLAHLEKTPWAAAALPAALAEALHRQSLSTSDSAA